jgi:hypothetical protein
MQGLLLKLSMLDAGAENAVRLISFFDSLMEQGVGLEVLVSRAAMVAECPLGVQARDGGFALRGCPDGAVDGRSAEAGAVAHDVGSHHLAWLARGGGQALPLDELLLERFAIACIAAIGRRDAMLPSFGDPALLELAIGGSAAAPERARALYLLGFDPSALLTMLAVTGPSDEFAGVAAAIAGRAHHVAPVASTYAVLLAGQAPPGLKLPRGFTAGVGRTVRGLEAPRSWDQAVRALRFAVPSDGHAVGGDRAVVYAAELGPLELLAEKLRSSDILDVPDVEALDLLAAEGGGADVLRTLECFVDTGSLREAARRLHLHHNSVAARVTRAERLLGYSMTGPRGSARVGLAIALRRLRDRDLLA